MTGTTGEVGAFSHRPPPFPAGLVAVHQPVPDRHSRPIQWSMSSIIELGLAVELRCTRTSGHAVEHDDPAPVSFLCRFQQTTLGLPRLTPPDICAVCHLQIIFGHVIRHSLDRRASLTRAWTGAAMVHTYVPVPDLFRAETRAIRTPGHPLDSRVSQICDPSSRYPPVTNGGRPCCLSMV